MNSISVISIKSVAALSCAALLSLPAAPCAADDCSWKGPVQDLDVQRSPGDQGASECHWKGPPHQMLPQANGGSNDAGCTWKGPPGSLTPMDQPPVSPDECYWKGTGNGLDIERGPCWVDGYEKNPHPLGAINDVLAPNGGDPNIAAHRCSGADVNGDQRIDDQDLIMVLESWGAHHGAADCNADGCVDALDLIAILAEWGLCG